jgi:hypothetical protein
MDNMNYSGLRHTTQTLGTYEYKYRSSLHPVGRHTFAGVSRPEEITFKDIWMTEAFSQYPGEFNFSKLEGWSRSYYTSEGHLDAIYNFSDTIRFPKPTDSSMKAADEYANAYFDQLPKVLSMSFHTDLDKVPFEPTSAAGIGLQGKKGDPGNHEKAINQAYATVKNAQRRGLTYVIENSTPDMAFTRTQLTELSKGIKVRHVFGEAFQYIILEGLTASPAMDMFTENETFFFVGQDPRIYVPILIEKTIGSNPKVASFDWTAFDATAETWEIEDAFNLLDRIFTFPDEESQAAYEISKVLFIYRKIAAPNGTVYQKARGVPSGSFYTMLIDSIINWKRILYLHHRAYGFFPKSLKTQGDDSFAGVHEQFTAHDLYLAIPAKAPWIFNPFKCEVGDSGSQVPFLQRKLKWGDQSREVDKVERLAIYPEYEVNDPQISAYRARALWEDTNYESLILGFATGYLEDKYGIPKTIPKYHKHYWEILFKK